jgi:hypothetical protein
MYLDDLGSDGGSNLGARGNMHDDDERIGDPKKATGAEYIADAM